MAPYYNILDGPSHHASRCVRAYILDRHVATSPITLWRPHILVVLFRPTLRQPHTIGNGVTVPIVALLAPIKYRRSLIRSTQLHISPEQGLVIAGRASLRDRGPGFDVIVVDGLHIAALRLESRGEGVRFGERLGRQRPFVFAGVSGTRVRDREGVLLFEPPQTSHRIVFLEVVGRARRLPQIS
jgi:hypothetical protein